tara:strand:+ start:1882 stop:2649 length:768 start_codon:yes stop_codon:yes gene_type:complete
MQFTFDALEKLYEAFLSSDYNFITVRDFFSTPKKKKNLILRHDVDRFPIQSLKMAKLENEMNISGTYYFRTRRHTFKPEIIKQIITLGHEIGYHYENLSDCRGNYEKAKKNFEINLGRLNKYFTIRTICMHGSPLGPWDNKLIWEKYNYRNYGIIADTSYDINFNEVFYITDNGWGWNKKNSSIRDKVKTNFDIPIKSTHHFIELVKNNILPNNIMLNAHPDTFFNPGFKWLANMIMIKSKNVIKRELVRFKVFE